MANAFKDVSVGAFDVAGKFFREATSSASSASSLPP